MAKRKRTYKSTGTTQAPERRQGAAATSSTSASTSARLTLANYGSRQTVTFVERRARPYTTSYGLHSPKWHDIPLDILRLIIDQADQVTLRKLCLVSRMTYSLAKPLLYRKVTLRCSEFTAWKFTYALERLITGNGKYVKKLIVVNDIDCSDYESFDDVMPQPMDYAIATLVNLAIQGMPQLKTFNWNSTALPSNDIINSLRLKRLKTFKVESDGLSEQPRGSIFNFGGFDHLRNLHFSDIASISLVGGIRDLLATSTSIRNLFLGFIDEYEDMVEEDLGVFEILFPVRNGEAQGVATRKLESFTVANYRPIESLPGPYFPRHLPQCLRGSDCLSFSEYTNDTIKELGENLDDLRLRKLRCRMGNGWYSMKPYLERLNKLETVAIESKACESGSLNYGELIPLLVRNGRNLRELKCDYHPLCHSGDHWDRVKTETAQLLVESCPNIETLHLKADFESWDAVQKIIARSLPNLTDFRLREREEIESVSHPYRRPELRAPHVLYTSGFPSLSPPLQLNCNPPNVITRRRAQDLFTSGFSLPAPAAANPRAKAVKKATAFASAFVNAARARVALGEEPAVKLQYITFQAYFFELWKREDGRYVLSELPDPIESRKVPRPFLNDEYTTHYPPVYMRLSTSD